MTEYFASQTRARQQSADYAAERENERIRAEQRVAAEQALLKQQTNAAAKKQVRPATLRTGAAGVLGNPLLSAAQLGSYG